jgi:uncharacterized membrane protein
MKNLLIGFIAIILFCVALTSGVASVAIGISEGINQTGEFGLFYGMFAIFAISAIIFGKINSTKFYI